MAESIHHTLPSMYSAFSGNELYLTDSLFKKICDAFPHTFNLQYLLTGEGELTTVEEQMPNAYLGDKPEYEVNIIDIYSHLIADLELIRRETKKELAEIRTIKSELRQAQQQLIEAAENFRHINHQYNYPTATTSKAAEESPTNN
jgi:hypothetical protein